MAQQRFFYPDEAKGGQERAVLVGTVLPGSDRDDEEENLLELARLARAAGARVLHALMQERSAPDVSTYIGKGKVEELAELCREREANLIIVDNELSPVQARNLEKRTDTNVCDRTELILDIFARRARTRQARLQVELAQLEYLRPRLRRMWEHLSRQAGGIGTRGPGETQLEVDRRRLGDRMAQLKRELEKVARVSETKARQRRRRAFSVALVGYTNVGKSSLLNALTDAGVLVEDALFATLDSTTRRLDLADGEPVLLTDTVGFVRKLPHHLVESFKATLAEVREADLVLHVADLAAPDRDRQIHAVEEVLGDLDVDPERCLRVFNKLDAAEPGTGERLEARWPGSLTVSASTGEGLDALCEAIRQRRREAFRQTVLFLPVSAGALTARIYGECEVLDVRYEPEGAYYLLRLPEPARARLLAGGAEERPELLGGWEPLEAG
ncbi:MAG: GTPase HflX [Candidatus Krumholzibacteriia bacterium]|nr:GTPase HflX [bacterium]MCB9513985.1 GTPase HflX [Candidatus Latescibacterota bacterium]MCB9517017.1 GTPase HflX [Candidatus Latescibacterota bacterium]